MDKKIKKITYGRNVYGKEEIFAVNNVLRKTTQMSKNVFDFETKVAKLFGMNYGVMVNSGSSAIILAIKILGLEKNDEVIVPCLNFGTALSSLILFGLKPVLVDININTLQIDEKKIVEKITKKTKALMIPNLIGNLPDWNAISRVAKKYRLKVIADSADTIGCSFNKKPLGKYADLIITSFYGSHVISCAGNGGMLILNKKNEYLKAKILRSWGRLSSIAKDSENIKERLNIKIGGYNYDRKFVFQELGFNFEPSEIGAAFGLEQLKKLKLFSALRNKNYNHHIFFFKNFSQYFITPKIFPKVLTNFLAYPIIIKENKFFNRRQLQLFLEKKNIQTRPIFSGNILRHPAFKFLINKNNNINSYFNADYIMRNGILVGCHQGLTKKEIIYVHDNIRKFLDKNCER